MTKFIYSNKIVILIFFYIYIVYPYNCMKNEGAIGYDNALLIFFSNYNVPGFGKFALEHRVF